MRETEVAQIMALATKMMSNVDYADRITKWTHWMPLPAATTT